MRSKRKIKAQSSNWNWKKICKNLLSHHRKLKNEIHKIHDQKRSQHLRDLENDIQNKQLQQKESAFEALKKKELDKKLQLAIDRGEAQYNLVRLRRVRLAFLNWRLYTLESIQIFEKYVRLRNWKKYQSVWSQWKTAIKWKRYKREAEIASFKRKKELVLEQKASRYYQTTLLSKVVLAWHLSVENESMVRVN